MQFILTLEQVNSIMTKLGNIPYMFSQPAIDEIKSYIDPQYIAQAPAPVVPDALAETPAAE